MESHLVGRRMADLEFDERVDAVTAATISSAIAFDEIRQVHHRVRPLLDEGKPRDWGGG